MQEQRLIERLKKYWHSLKGEAVLPEIRKFNDAMIADLWPNCLLLELVDVGNENNRQYRYEYMGEAIKNVYGNDLTGHYVNEHMHHFPGWQILSTINTLLTNPGMNTTEGTFINDHHKVIKYRACLMPFATNSKLSHVLVGLSWKQF